MKWISVDDQMPELRTNVLVAVRKYEEPTFTISIGFTRVLGKKWDDEGIDKDAIIMWIISLSGLTDYDFDENEERIFRVLYWMPLPDSPLIPHKREQE